MIETTMAGDAPLVAELRVTHGHVVTFLLGDADMLELAESVEPDEALEAIIFEARRRARPVGVRFTGDLPDGVRVDESGMSVCLPDGAWIPWTGEYGLQRRGAVLADFDDGDDSSGLFDLPVGGGPSGGEVDGDLDDGDDLTDEAWVSAELMNPDKASSGVATIRTPGTVTSIDPDPGNRKRRYTALGAVGALLLLLTCVLAITGGNGSKSGGGTTNEPVAGPGRHVVKPVDVPAVTVKPESRESFPHGYQRLWRTKIGDAGGVSATPFAVVVARPGGLRFVHPRTGKTIGAVDVTGPVDMLTWTEAGSRRLVVWRQGRTLSFFEPANPRGGVARVKVPNGARISTLSTGMLMSVKSDPFTVRVGGGRKLNVVLRSAGQAPSAQMSCFAVTKSGDCLWAGRSKAQVAVGDTDPVQLGSPGTGLVRTSWVAVTPQHTLTLWSSSTSPSTGTVPVVAAIHDTSTGKLKATWQTTWSSFTGARMFEESSSSPLVAYGPLLVDLDEGTFRARTDVDGTSFGAPVGGVPVLLTGDGPAVVDDDLTARPVDVELLVGLVNGGVVVKEPGGSLAAYAPKGT